MGSRGRPAKGKVTFSAAILQAGLLSGLLSGLLYNSPASAQISGEILVGRVASPQASAPSAPDPFVPGKLAEPQSVVLPLPRYPRAARLAGREGRVMVCFTVDERGMVHTPAVRATTDPIFNQPVLDAISASRFTPARIGSKLLRSTACRNFQFVLR